MLSHYELGHTYFEEDCIFDILDMENTFSTGRGQMYSFIIEQLRPERVRKLTKMRENLERLITFTVKFYEFDA